jgi:hypothetical protein
MSTFDPITEPRIADVGFTCDFAEFVLTDGREIRIPLQWLPSLRDATDAQRANWRVIAQGVGVHWSDLDEDILAENLLAPRMALTRQA